MTARPAPYPADTKAKGWRFELDLERVLQSDTWDLASEVPMAQQTLLMIWTVAWLQVPCGSMPSDPEVVRAKVKVPPKLWAPMRDIVLRGWWLADDGRLYHDTIVERVQDMLGRKQSERQRKADFRAKKEAERLAQSSGNVPQMSHGTNTGQTQDGQGKDDTGTGTGTGTKINTNTPLSPLARGNPDQSETKPEDQPKAKRQRKPKAEASTFTAWLSDLKAKGEKAILPADPIFATASECGIPADFVRFAWFSFRERYADSSKTYADWRATFRNAVKGNWLKLWWVNPETDAYELTTAGHQVRIALENRNAEAAA